MNLQRSLLSLLTLALAGPGTLTVPAALLLTTQARAQDFEKDDPKGRRKDRLEWEGTWTPQYRRFLMEAAGKERLRYHALMPKAGAEPFGVAALGSTWVNLGPTDSNVAINGSYKLNTVDSGRGRTLLIHPADPKRLYYATAGGGVWRSQDGGATWTPITETLGSLSVGAMAMDPANPDVLYLGLGDPFDGTGLGFLKSTDGGATWSTPVFLGTTRVTNAIAVSAKDPKVILVATNQGLYRSADAGASFSPVTVAGGTPYLWTLASGGSGAWALSGQPEQLDGKGQVWTSADDGLTWTAAAGIPATGIDRVSVASAPSQPLVMYALASDPSGGTADLFRSADGGRSWTSLDAASKAYSNPNADGSGLGDLLGGQGWYNHAIAIDPADPGHVVFGGQLTLAETKDSGATFGQVTSWLGRFGLPYVHADFHGAAFDGQGRLYAVTDGGLFVTTDQGATWSHLNKGIASHLVYSVGSSLNRKDLVAGGFQDNGTRVRVGQSGTFDQTLGGDGFGTLVHPLDASRVLGSLYFTRIAKSADGGATWATATSGISGAGSSGSSPFRTRIVGDLSDGTGNTVYTFTNSKVYKSTDFAGSWTALGTTGLPATSFKIRGLAVCKADGQALAVIANAGQMYVTASSGASWTKAGAQPNSGGYLASVWFDTTTKTILYASTVEPDAAKSHLFKSTDFGATWAAIDGNGLPTGVPVNVVVNDPQDSKVLYAGTHLGLYRSTDAGASWCRFGSGMPLVSVTDIYVAPDSSLVRVATFGRGFWELQPPPPDPDITATITEPSAEVTVASGTPVSFAGTASSAKGAALAIQWSFGDGTTAAGHSASHAFANTTNQDLAYAVTFIATAPDGAYGRATRTVTVLGDHVLPTVSASVTAGASGAFTFSATASDNQGIKGVDFYVDGIRVGAGSGSGGTFTLAFQSTNLLTNGSHTLTARATDLAGNPADSAGSSFTVNNPLASGTLLETEPNDTPANAHAVDGSTALILGTLSTLADTDHYAFTLKTGGKLKLDLDGLRSGSLDYDLLLLDASGAEIAKSDGATMQETLSWTNTTAAPVTLTAKVVTYDPKKGLPNSSPGFHYSLKPTWLDILPPTVGDPSVAGNSGTLALSATAADDTAIAKVEFHVDGVLAGSATTGTAGTYTLNLDSTSLANGTHWLVAKAYDPSGNLAVSHSVPFGVQNSTFNVLKNGGFEQQMAGWTQSNWYASTLTPHGGAYTASSFSSQASTSLAQGFTVPASATAAQLSLWIRISTAETGTTAKDTLSLRLKDGSGTVLQTLKTLSNLDKTPFSAPYAQHTFDLSAYQGQTLTLSMEATQDGVNATFFSVDDIALNATVPVADAVPPTLQNAAVQGSAGPLAFSADATDNVGVAQVEFVVDGLVVGTVTSATAGKYAFTADAIRFGNGSHTFVARAFDAAGNITLGAPVPFTIADTFTEKLANPGFEEGFSGWTQSSWAVGTVDGTAHRGAKYALGNVLTNGGPLSQTFALPANLRAGRLSWWMKMDVLFSNKATADDLLAVEVKDVSGAVLASRTYTNLQLADFRIWSLQDLDLTPFKGQSLSVTFTSTLKNFFFYYLDDVSVQAALIPDTAAPVVGTPFSNGTSGTVQLSVTASDDVALAKVEFLVDGGAPISATGSGATWSASLDTTALANGAHTLAARATDGAGNVTTSATANFTVNNAAPEVAVSLSRTAATLLPGASLSFTATVGNAANTAVTWSIQETGGGTLDSANANPVTYTAPRKPGTYHLVATSVADPSKTATATLRVFGTNPDGSLDQADLAALADAWGTRDAAFDLNQDGSVDDLDLNLLLDAIRKG